MITTETHPFSQYLEISLHIQNLLKYFLFWGHQHFDGGLNTLLSKLTLLKTNQFTSINDLPSSCLSRGRWPCGLWGKGWLSSSLTSNPFQSLLRACHIGFFISGGLGARSSNGNRDNGGHWRGEETVLWLPSQWGLHASLLASSAIVTGQPQISINQTNGNEKLWSLLFKIQFDTTSRKPTKGLF